LIGESAGVVFGFSHTSQEFGVGNVYDITYFVSSGA